MCLRIKPTGKGFAMLILDKIQDSVMKISVQIADVVALAKAFRSTPGNAMKQVVAGVHSALRSGLEQVMAAEIALFLGEPAEAGNKRNGYVTRDFAFKGVGVVQLRVPRDRAGRFVSAVVPARRRYDEATEKDLALLHLAGLSTRTLSQVSRRVLGVSVSRQEVSNALHTVLPAAKAFLERPLGQRRWKYLYVDGTNFRVRRTTVEREPTLVVVGVDETSRKSVLSMVQGDKDARDAWALVFADLKERGLDSSAVELGIMDGLAGLGDVFLDAFPRAKVARCWVHKARNVFPLVPRRYQAAFKVDWDAVAYAESEPAARAACVVLKQRWTATCGDAVARLERDLDALLTHYLFPREHWEALRTTNPIERVNREFKRRSKAMDGIGPDGLKALLAFTALRLEIGWSTTPIDSKKLSTLRYRTTNQEKELEDISQRLLLN
jgi:putative transposase